MASALTLRGAVLVVDGVGVVVAGPSGTGKTGVLLALAGDGAVMVAPEAVDVEVSTLVLHGRAAPLRLRARHVPTAPWVLDGLARGERLRLRVGAALTPLPRLGRRVGRRVFVDVEPDRPLPLAVDPSPAARLGLVVVLEPVTTGLLTTTPLEPGDAARALQPWADGPADALEMVAETVPVVLVTTPPGMPDPVLADAVTRRLATTSASAR